MGNNEGKLKRNFNSLPAEVSLLGKLSDNSTGYLPRME